jgi:hypothetical protein
MARYRTVMSTLSKVSSSSVKTVNEIDHKKNTGTAATIVTGRKLDVKKYTVSLMIDTGFIPTYQSMA